MISFNCKKTLIVTHDVIWYNPPLHSCIVCRIFFLGHLRGMVLLCQWRVILVFYCLVFYCVILACSVCLYFVFVIFVTEVFKRPSGEDSP